MKRKPLWTALAAITILAAALAGLAWNEARKEIVFLCANFTAGVSGESVLRQLETGQFLRYRREATARGERIVADSAYTFGAHACVVDLGPGGAVLQARVE